MVGDYADAIASKRSYGVDAPLFCGSR
jgi:hypothetical protein